MLPSIQGPERTERAIPGQTKPAETGRAPHTQKEDEALRAEIDPAGDEIVSSC